MKKYRFIVLLAAVIALAGIVFFPKLSMEAPEEVQTEQFSFAAYSQFSKESREDFYIQQTKAEDIQTGSSAVLCYAENSVVLLAADETPYESMEALAEHFHAEICGYIAAIDFYQLHFQGEFDYEGLLELCTQLESSELVLEAHVDLFDVFPEEGGTIDEECAMWGSMDEMVIVPDGGEAVLPEGEEGDVIMMDTEGADSVEISVEDPSADLVNAAGILPYHDKMQPVSVGILDYPVDYTHDDLEVANGSDYDVDFIYEGRAREYGHGTQVAGIIAAQQDNEIGIDGLSPSAQLYSYNAANETVAYRTAALVRMIAEDGVRAINFSIAYPTEISVSAHLGNANAQLYIQNEAEYYAQVFQKLLDSGYDFLICQGAGNENGTAMVEDPGSYFGYTVAMTEGTGTILVEDMDAKYAFFTAGISDSSIADHILVVGACESENQLASFSNVGSRVDVVAPGMMVQSTYPLNSVVPAFGTSIAAPFATGTAACMYALDPDLTAAEVKAAIIDSASVMVAGHYPLLNAGMAVEYVLAE